MKHALKIESCDLKLRTADAIVEALKDFAESVNYSGERISDLECRRRDGFIPFNHNLGGIECVAFMDRHSMPNGRTGFENADKTLDKYEEYDIKSFEEHINKKRDLWTEQDDEAYYEYNSNDTESTVLFSLDMMYNGKSVKGNHLVNLRFCVSAKDAPYHRQYDDKVEINVLFKNVSELKKKLKALLKRKDVNRFANNVRDAF